MTRPAPEEFEFVHGDTEAVVDRMRALATEGTGWVNVRPVIAREDEPPPPSPFAIFGAPANPVPVVTWMPGKRGSDGTTRRTTVGLQHGSGPRVVLRLRELDLPLPDGWRVTQDHPRRGLVAQVPAEADPGATLDWLLRAATAVCAVPSTGRWRAAVHAGSR